MRANNLRLRACVCGVLAAAAVSGSAIAQEKTALLEEIVVTAQKRQESVQDIAIAVTAITSEQRDIVGIISIQDLTDFTPGLSYTTTLDRISLRGIGRLTNNYGSDPGVATYADGFYTQSTTEAGKRPILLERTEILRGPQGTLYGRNSIGGAINVISKRPTDSFYGEVRATAGSYDSGILEAALSGPMTDFLRYRVAGFSGQQSRGYFEDIDGDATEGGKYKDWYVEGQLEFNVGESVDGWLKYSRAQWDQARRTLVTTTPREIAPTYWNIGAALSPNTSFNGSGATQTVSATFLEPNPALTDNRKYDTDTPFLAKLRDNHIVTLELIGHLGFADLKYVGGWQDYHYDQISDFDNSDRPPFVYTPPGNPYLGGARVPRPTLQTQLDGFYAEEKDYFSHELNLISTGDGPLQWIGGLYFYREKVLQWQGYRSKNQAELDNPTRGANFSAMPYLTAPPYPASALVFPGYGSPNPERNLSNAGVDLVASSAAAFGQIDWQFADEWKATVGLRYTKDKKDATEFRTRVIHDLPFSTALAPSAAGVLFVQPFYTEDNRLGLLSGEWDAVTGTIGAEWTPTDDMLLFAKYTRGYKSGGFNGGNFSGDARALGSPAVPIASLPPVVPAQADEIYTQRGQAYTKPEYINAYELGLKLTSWDRLTNNVSIFYYDYQNMQAPLTVRDQTSGLNITQFYNFEKTVNAGFELESVFAATSQWNVVFTYGYLYTENKDKGCFTDSADTAAPPGTDQTSPFWAPDHRACTLPFQPPALNQGALQHVEGDRLPSAPDHKIAFNTNYTFDTAIGDITASATWTYRSDVYYAVFEREHYKAPAYDQTDARLIWTGPETNFTVIAFVQNVFDDDGYDSAGATQNTWQAGLGTRTQTIGLTAPRTAGIELQFRFGGNE